jgi:predicted DNA-binding transcriptional regulator YafY
MQRIVQAEISHKNSQLQPAFDLDAYIQGSHMLSHRLYQEPDDIAIELRVNSTAIFHFRERPLSERQVISPSDQSGFYRVRAELPWTVHLVPFFLSMGNAVEVIEPAVLRNKVREQLLNSLESYKLN